MTTRLDNFNASGINPHEDAAAILEVFRVNYKGVLNTSVPIASFSQIQLKSTQEQDTEKTQIALSSDAPKLYTFGRQHRIFNYQAFIGDTNLSSDIEIPANNSVWTGRSYSEWQDFYDNFAKLSVCAERRYVVQLTYANKRILGAINMMAVSGYADQPHIYDVVFSFYATSVEDLDGI